MNKKQIDALEKCIEFMETGAPLGDCIKEYPDLTPEMQKILETAEEAMSLQEERVPIEAMNRSRIKLLSQAKLLGSSNKDDTPVSGFVQLTQTIKQAFLGLSSLRPLAGRLVLVIGITGLLIFFSRGLLITSAKSLPGDSLYPVKRAVEDISVYLVPSSEIRQEYEDNYYLQRVEEVKRLIGLKRIQKISFEGILESVSNTDWSVSGIPVSLEANTTIVGGLNGTQSVEPGSIVKVEGITNAQGWVSANEIHLREYQFNGLVESIDPNYWQISGVQLYITPGTQIDNDIRVGDIVTALIRSKDSGLYALAILHEVQRVVTPVMQQSQPVDPTASEDRTPVIEEEHHIVGVLEKTDSGYWVVSGQIVYIVGDTHISGDIKLGDYYSINYKIEPNGSFTAIEIEKIENNDHPGEHELQATPEFGGEAEHEGTSIVEPAENYKDEKSTTTPENHRTPEPTENHTETP